VVTAKMPQVGLVLEPESTEMFADELTVMFPLPVSLA